MVQVLSAPSLPSLQNAASQNLTHILALSECHVIILVKGAANSTHFSALSVHQVSEASCRDCHALIARPDVIILVKGAAQTANNALKVSIRKLQARECVVNVKRGFIRER